MNANNVGLSTKITMFVVALLALAAVQPARVTAQLPPGVTPERIGEGQALYFGDGRCDGCHGEDAKGIQGVGTDLTDGEWRHADGGSFPALIDVISKGLTHEKTEGWAMPGGAEFTDQQVRELAAYIWSLVQRNPPSLGKQENPRP
jgi:mono/diheme cytochrome c family protein